MKVVKGNTRRHVDFCVLPRNYRSRNIESISCSSVLIKLKRPISAEMRVILTSVVFLLAIGLRAEIVQMQDTIKVPGIKQSSGGGRGDGTGGGRGDGSGGGRQSRLKVPEEIRQELSENNQAISSEMGMDSLSYKGLLSLAKSYFDVNIDSSIYYAEAALLASIDLSSKEGEIRSRYALNPYYLRGLKPKEVLENSDELLQLIAARPAANAGAVYESMALSYELLGRAKDAESAWNKAIEYAWSKEDTIAVVIDKINLGGFHRSQRDFSKEVKVYEEALAQAEKLGNHVAVHYLFGLLGTAYSELDQNEQAEHYLQKSLRLKQMHYRPVSLAYGFYHLQEFYLKTGDLQKSIEMGEKLQEVLNINPGTYLFKRSLVATRKAHESLGLPIPELIDQSNYPVLDELNQQEQLMQERQIIALHNNDRTSKFIDDQSAEIGNLEETTKFQRELLAYGISGLVFIFGGAYLYRSRAFALKENRIQEDFSQQLLTYQEEERLRISRDLHDSVGQSLILIKNKVQLEKDEETSAMITETLEEVRSISKQLHPLLLEKLGLTAAIEKLVEDVDSSSDIFIESEIENVNNQIDKESELHVYRIMQEAVNNMVKHSETKSAKVRVEKKDRQLVCEVVDHGRGFDLTESPDQFRSLGMLTLKERTKILGGKLSIDSTKGRGTTITLLVNLPNA